MSMSEHAVSMRLNSTFPEIESRVPSSRVSRPKSFIFPQAPFAAGSIFMCVNQEMAKELIALIKDTCCDDRGNVVDDGCNEELVGLAEKLQNNMDFSDFHRERRRRFYNANHGND